MGGIDGRDGCSVLEVLDTVKRRLLGSGHARPPRCWASLRSAASFHGSFCCPQISLFSHAEHQPSDLTTQWDHQEQEAVLTHLRAKSRRSSEVQPTRAEDKSFSFLFLPPLCNITPPQQHPCLMHMAGFPLTVPRIKQEYFEVWYVLTCTEPPSTVPVCAHIRYPTAVTTNTTQHTTHPVLVTLFSVTSKSTEF